MVLLVIAAVLFVWNGGSLPSPLPQGSSSPTPTPTPSTSSGQADNMIRVSSPKPGEAIQSPVHIEGEARGNWYFEASFPGRVLDANGKILGLMPIQAQGDWMTTEFVPFKADLPFSTPATNTGFVVLQKDNPSGLPQNEDERRIPIKFGP
ncbi:MAG: hypothetical protein UW30_C0011G0014 [Candidatus Giovannonibacteria bacterium GW2011_GWA2_44_13b]|uniref:Bacterial spore germination immunoglobulin-like domain-containing protein n=2 Tax=Candidatus Giovannoniibacteriota TaxID=1752738 RepID=A0A0G1H3U8_9BACT|nr:MAG: hypothetical protein UW30_C0011G0014 [Candidatus Giovannonibacteria bacterium GW2011_GWA2_44_13b]